MGFKLPNGSDLSEEQLDIINLPVTQDWVIKGAPGTGKTVMAIYRAGQASQMSKGRPVLMLVYNRPLMQFLSSAIQGNYYKNVSVYTYSRWISELYSEYGLGSVPKVYNQYDWQKISAQLSGIKNLYSHVIIDEAQDFPIELLKILKRLSDHMTCFIDPNQAIEVGKTDTFNTIKTVCVEAPYKLTHNFRNTKPIRDLSALYCRDGEPAPSQMPGRKPTIIKCKEGNFNDMYQKMIDIISRNKEKDIGIIVNNKALNATFNTLKERLPKGMTVQMYKTMTPHQINFDRPGVKILSYGTMKGLEFDVVLLPMFDKIESQDHGIIDSNRAYVAVSRPLSELYLFYWSERPSVGRVNTMAALTSHKDLLEWK